MNKKKVEKLEKIAAGIRIEILKMSSNASSAHSGGSLSCVEILTVLYFHELKLYPKNPTHPNRDRVVFSKGHDVKALYATLALKGFFPKKLLTSYEQNGGTLPGHSTRNCVPGIEVTSGSLGHGLSIAAGMAYTAKLNNRNHRVIAILSDGECDEGSTWEALLFAAQHRLDNLTVIIDYNKLQGYGFTKDILDLEPFENKLKSFNCRVLGTNGNSIENLAVALKRITIEKGKPSVIIAHTIKGLGGVVEHINKVSSQYKPPTLEQAGELIKKLRI